MGASAGLVQGYAVKVRVGEESIDFRSKTGRLRLRITQRKTGRRIEPLTADEKKRLDELDAPRQSLIGFLKGTQNLREAKWRRQNRSRQLVHPLRPRLLRVA
jgi:hypothetical protein